MKNPTTRGRREKKREQKIRKNADYSERMIIFADKTLLYPMNITFENTALAELYHNGTTQERRYKRLTQDIIKRYIKVVNFLRAARRLEDLFLIKSLN